MSARRSGTGRRSRKRRRFLPRRRSGCRTIFSWCERLKLERVLNCAIFVIFSAIPTTRLQSRILTMQPKSRTVVRLRGHDEWKADRNGGRGFSVIGGVAGDEARDPRVEILAKSAGGVTVREPADQDTDHQAIIVETDVRENRL